LRMDEQRRQAEEAPQATDAMVRHG
jgi:hypothetical protein